MAVTEQNILLTSKDREGSTVMYYPITTVENVDGAISESDVKENYVDLTSAQTITAQKTFGTAPLFTAGAYMPVSASLTFYNGAPNRVAGIFTVTNYSGNAATATKATQDGDGNVIADTYAKSDKVYTKEEVEDLVAVFQEKLDLAIVDFNVEDNRIVITRGNGNQATFLVSSVYS